MIKLNVYYSMGDDFSGPFKKSRFLVSMPYSSDAMEKRIKELVDDMIKKMENLYKEWLEENQIDYIFKVTVTENEPESCFEFESIIIFENDDEAMAFKLVFT